MNWVSFESELDLGAGILYAFGTYRPQVHRSHRYREGVPTEIGELQIPNIEVFYEYRTPRYAHNDGLLNP